MAIYYAVSNSNALSHHGIKGQKWGVRRFQNEDGSLTDLGQKRYGKRFEKRQKEISGYLDSAKRYEKYAADTEAKKKAVLKDKNAIDREYKKMYGNDDVNYVRSITGANASASKRDIVAQEYDQLSASQKRQAKEYRQKAELIMKMPINKLTRNEMNKVTSGISRVNGALTTIGAVSTTVALKKLGVSTTSALQGASMSAAINIIMGHVLSKGIGNAISNKRENEILKNSNN